MKNGFCFSGDLPRRTVDLSMVIELEMFNAESPAYGLSVLTRVFLPAGSAVRIEGTGSFICYDGSRFEVKVNPVRPVNRWKTRSKQESFFGRRFNTVDPPCDGYDEERFAERSWNARTTVPLYGVVR